LDRFGRGIRTSPSSPSKAMESSTVSTGIGKLEMAKDVGASFAGKLHFLQLWKVFISFRCSAVHFSSSGNPLTAWELVADGVDVVQRKLPMRPDLTRHGTSSLSPNGRFLAAAFGTCVTVWCAKVTHVSHNLTSQSIRFKWNILPRNGNQSSKLKQKVRLFTLIVLYDGTLPVQSWPLQTKAQK
jgi:hypothetical protein